MDDEVIFEDPISAKIYALSSKSSCMLDGPDRISQPCDKGGLRDSLFYRPIDKLTTARIITAKLPNFMNTSRDGLKESSLYFCMINTPLCFFPHCTNVTADSQTKVSRCVATPTRCPASGGCEGRENVRDGSRDRARNPGVASFSGRGVDVQRRRRCILRTSSRCTVQIIRSDVILKVNYSINYVNWLSECICVPFSRIIFDTRPIYPL